MMKNCDLGLENAALGRKNCDRGLENAIRGRLGQHFQDLGHSFSPYGPTVSRQITFFFFFPQ